MSLKQKPLLPTLKEKKRYITYQAHSKETITGKTIVTTLNSILGSLDAAEAGLVPITHDEATNQGIIRTSLKAANKTRMAMLLTKEIMIQPLKTSGVLKKAKQTL
ncbi:hypothetical protein GOV10_04870 [Candidatus Woesearchaeota archaeon]|nr:hypothetical protein [Candidatus Woesearchaeota archaeon]